MRDIINPNGIYAKILSTAIIVVTVLGTSFWVYRESLRPDSSTQQEAFSHSNNPNPPEITSTPVTTATVGEPYIYDVEAMEPDGDPLLFYLIDSPPGMAMDVNTGKITWETEASNVGVHSVEFFVGDSRERRDHQSFTITVSFTAP